MGAGVEGRSRSWYESSCCREVEEVVWEQVLKGGGGGGLGAGVEGRS